MEEKLMFVWIWIDAWWMAEIELDKRDKTYGFFRQLPAIFVRNVAFHLSNQLFHFFITIDLHYKKVLCLGS